MLKRDSYFCLSDELLMFVYLDIGEVSFSTEKLNHIFFSRSLFNLYYET